MRNILKPRISLLMIPMLLLTPAAFAAGPPAPSIFDNPMAVLLIVLMILLLIVIGLLAGILVNSASVKLKKRNAGGKGAVAAILTGMLLLSAPTLMAQDAPKVAAPATNAIAGMPASTYYVMAAVIFLELAVIIVLLLNIKLLLRAEKAKLLATDPALEEAAKANRLSWWDRFNKLRPVSQEAELDLGHEYDGIRELNNRLPPWWLYGFYISIIFAAVYLWRFHVSHTAPSSSEEYERSVVKAEKDIKEYLKLKGESVDENTVTLLAGEDDLSAGKLIFSDPSKCMACHNADGGGNTIGPNLVDQYWLYGGSVQDIFKTIKYGTNKGMRSWKDDLSPKQIAQVVSYIKSIQGTKPANAREPQGELYNEEPAGLPAGDSAINGTVKSPIAGN